MNIDGVSGLEHQNSDEKFDFTKPHQINSSTLASQMYVYKKDETPAFSDYASQQTGIQYSQIPKFDKKEIMTPASEIKPRKKGNSEANHKFYDVSAKETPQNN